MTMKFVKTMKDYEDLKQAVFQHGEAYYLYSYSRKPEMNVDEVMVFRCTPGGSIVDYAEVACHRGYVPSTEVMKELEESLNNRKATHSS